MSCAWHRLPLPDVYCLTVVLKGVQRLGLCLWHLLCFSLSYLTLKLRSEALNLNCVPAAVVWQGRGCDFVG